MTILTKLWPQLDTKLPIAGENHLSIVILSTYLYIVSITLQLDVSIKIQQFLSSVYELEFSQALNAIFQLKCWASVATQFME